MTIPRGAPERWGLAYNDCSESAYAGIYSDGQSSKPTAYTGPTLMAIPQGVP